jgi:hypothetical protein
MLLEYPFFFVLAYSMYRKVLLIPVRSRYFQWITNSQKRKKNVIVHNDITIVITASSSWRRALKSTPTSSQHNNNHSHTTINHNVDGSSANALGVLVVYGWFYVLPRQFELRSDTCFTDEELTSVTPTEVERYMRFKAYGVPEHGPDDRRTKILGTSLMVMKKAISFFIPNRLPSWYPGRWSGNPTKSTEVNNVIKLVTRHECRA